MKKKQKKKKRMNRKHEIKSQMKCNTISDWNRGSSRDTTVGCEAASVTIKPGETFAKINIRGSSRLRHQKTERD